MGHQILIQASNTNVLLWPGAYTEKKTENLTWYDQDYTKVKVTINGDYKD